mmetsp:Transcript_18173/g.32019  ORF Transcript_18173/g.32019 Transcript_18173/m.32019 type:complete len:224 (-) Transcript_18173:356-1027(-)
MPRHNRPKSPPIHEPQITILPRPHRCRTRTRIQQRNLPKSHPRVEGALKIRSLVHAHAPRAQHVEPIPMIPLPNHNGVFGTLPSTKSINQILQFIRRTSLEQHIVPNSIVNQSTRPITLGHDGGNVRPRSFRGTVVNGNGRGADGTAVVFFFFAGGTGCGSAHGGSAHGGFAPFGGGYGGAVLGGGELLLLGGGAAVEGAAFGSSSRLVLPHEITRQLAKAAA